MLKKNALFLMVCFLVFGSLLFADNSLAGEDADTAGDILRFALPAAAYGTTFLQDDADGRGQFVKSFLTTVGLTYGLKTTIDHDGPNGKSQSFPSGHTAMAFSGASFLQKRYGWEYGLPAYAAAGFVGWSRIDSDEHDMADVMAGATISILSTYLFTTNKPGDLAMQATGDVHSLGIMLLGRW